MHPEEEKNCLSWDRAGPEGTQDGWEHDGRVMQGWAWDGVGFGLSWSKALHFPTAPGPLGLSVDAQRPVSIWDRGEHLGFGGTRYRYPGSILFLPDRTRLLFLGPGMGNSGCEPSCKHA